MPIEFLQSTVNAIVGSMVSYVDSDTYHLYSEIRRSQYFILGKAFPHLLPSQRGRLNFVLLSFATRFRMQHATVLYAGGSMRILAASNLTM